MAVTGSKKKVNARPKEIFLSHSHKDHAFTKKLAAALNERGVKTWYSGKNIATAAQWHDEIGKALSRCDWFLVVLTPSSVESIWVQREFVYALNDARYASRVIPLLKKPCALVKLSWTLEQFQRVDFTGKFDDGCRTLLKTWNIPY